VSTNAIRLKWDISTNKNVDLFLLNEIEFRKFMRREPFKFLFSQLQRRQFVGDFAEKEEFTNKLVVVIRNSDRLSVDVNWRLESLVPVGLDWLAGLLAVIVYVIIWGISICGSCIGIILCCTCTCVIFVCLVSVLLRPSAPQQFVITQPPQVHGHYQPQHNIEKQPLLQPQPTQPIYQQQQPVYMTTQTQYPQV